MTIDSAGRFENFESDHHYESNLESDVRFEIESNHKASQVPNTEVRLRGKWEKNCPGAGGNICTECPPPLCLCEKAA